MQKSGRGVLLAEQMQQSWGCTSGCILKTATLDESFMCAFLFLNQFMWVI